MNKASWVQHDLKVRRDDFSIQVSSGRDPRFWLRLELGSSDKVVVSDLKQSTFSDAVCAEILKDLMEFIHPSPEFDLVFADIAPNPDPAPTEAEGYRARATREFARLGVVVSTLAPLLGAGLRSGVVEPRRGKMDAVFRLVRGEK